MAKEYVERMQVEHKELTIKLEALHKLIYKNPHFNNLSDIERASMIKQSGFMKAYADELGSRIWRAE